MIFTHPYIDNAHLEELRQPDGSCDRILVLKSKIKRIDMLSAKNDNSMNELVRQIQSLDTLAKHGFADFQRVEIRDH